MDGCLARTITKIEANPLLVRGKSDFRIMRVAAYCRVSTDDEDQLNSYQAQIAYYTDAIAKRPNSTFAGIYADEGISGTQVKNRRNTLLQKRRLGFLTNKIPDYTMQTSRKSEKPESEVPESKIRE